MRHGLLTALSEFVDALAGAPQAPRVTYSERQHPRVPRGQPGAGQWARKAPLHLGPGPHPDGTPQAVHGGGAAPAQPAASRPADSYRAPTHVQDLQGRKIPAPRAFYRGTVPGATQRIRTTDATWDSYLFVADNERAARNYGERIQRVTAKPEAKIVYEGTGAFRELAKGLRPQQMRLLEYASTVAKRAQSAGFDAVWFKRQGDVGTAILNRAAFEAA